MRSVVILLLMVAFLGYCSFRMVRPGASYFVDIVALETVSSALKPASVSFGPLVHKRAPDGAYIVAGTAVSRGRDLSFQLRVEEICGAPEADCYRPKIVYLGKPL